MVLDGHFAYPQHQGGLRRRVALWLLDWREGPKVRRKVEPRFGGKKPHAVAPAIGDAIFLLPLVDGLPAHPGFAGEAEEVIQRLGDLLAAAERINECCVISRHAGSIGEILRLVNPEICEDDLEAAPLQNPVMGQKVRKPRDIESGHRLRLVREALGFKTKRAFVEHMTAPFDDGELRAKESLYTKWENGDHLVQFEFLEQIKRRYSVTLDYIYLGDMTGLPADLRERLIAAERHAKAH